MQLQGGAIGHAQGSETECGIPPLRVAAIALAEGPPQRRGSHQTKAVHESCTRSLDAARIGKGRGDFVLDVLRSLLVKDLRLIEHDDGGQGLQVPILPRSLCCMKGRATAPIELISTPMSTPAPQEMLRENHRLSRMAEPRLDVRSPPAVERPVVHAKGPL